MTEPLFSDGDEQMERALAQLRQLPKYPFEDETDRKFLSELRDEHPRLVLDVEVKKWRLWMMEHPSKRKVRWRVRLQTWFTRGSEYAARRGDSGNAAGQGRNAGPEGPDAHAPTSDRLEQW